MGTKLTLDLIVSTSCLHSKRFNSFIFCLVVAITKPTAVPALFIVLEIKCLTRPAPIFSPCSDGLNCVDSGWLTCQTEIRLRLHYSKAAPVSITKKKFKKSRFR